MELTGKLGKVERDILAEEKATTDFKSEFSFLSDHNGFRNGNLHCFMGVSHGGKSTLTRSLLLDVLTLKEKKKVLLWLSEESRLEFLTEFSQSNFTDYDEDQLLIYSEMDHDHDEKTTLQKIEDIVIKYDVDIVFFDNLTTSRIYMDKKVDIQAQVAKLLKNFASNWNIPIVLVAHTGANVTENYDKIINMNDIRGAKSIVNMIQFFYIMQNFQNGTKRTTTIRTTKHRGYVVKTPIYQLRFSTIANVFGDGGKIDFETFKEAYKMRDNLNGR